MRQIRFRFDGEPINEDSFLAGNGEQRCNWWVPAADRTCVPKVEVAILLWNACSYRQKCTLTWKTTVWIHQNLAITTKLPLPFPVPSPISFFFYFIWGGGERTGERASERESYWIKCIAHAVFHLTGCMNDITQASILSLGLQYNYQLLIYEIFGNHKKSSEGSVVP